MKAYYGGTKGGFYWQIFLVETEKELCKQLLTAFVFNDLKGFICCQIPVRLAKSICSAFANTEMGSESSQDAVSEFICHLCRTSIVKGSKERTVQKLIVQYKKELSTADLPELLASEYIHVRKWAEDVFNEKTEDTKKAG